MAEKQAKNQQEPTKQPDPAPKITTRPDVCPPGGRFIVAGRLVDSNGNPIKD